MKKLSKVILCLFVFLSFFLVACSNKNNNILDNPDAINLSEEDATEMFQTMYGMTNLTNQRVILLDNTIYIEFFFSKNATDSEIDSARSFALTTFVLQKISPYGEIPYMSLVDQSSKKINWVNTICNIYKSSELIYYEKYNGMKLEVSEEYKK